MALRPKLFRDGESEGKGFRSAMQFAGLGTQLAAAVVGFGLIGYWLDSSFKTGQLWTTIFLFLGAIGGLFNFIRTAIALGKKQGKSGRQE